LGQERRAAGRIIPGTTSLVAGPARPGDGVPCLPSAHPIRSVCALHARPVPGLAPRSGTVRVISRPWSQRRTEVTGGTSPTVVDPRGAARRRAPRLVVRPGTKTANAARRMRRVERRRAKYFSSLSRGPGPLVTCEPRSPHGVEKRLWPAPARRPSPPPVMDAGPRPELTQLRDLVPEVPSLVLFDGVPPKSIGWTRCRESSHSDGPPVLDRNREPRGPGAERSPLDLAQSAAGLDPEALLSTSTPPPCLLVALDGVGPGRSPKKRIGLA